MPESKTLTISTKLGFCSKCARDVKILHFCINNSKFNLCNDCWGELWSACANMDRAVFTTWELVAWPWPRE